MISQEDYCLAIIQKATGIIKVLRSIPEDLKTKENIELIEYNEKSIRRMQVRLNQEYQKREAEPKKKKLTFLGF